MPITGSWERGILGILGGAFRRIFAYFKSDQGFALSIIILMVVTALVFFGIIRLNITCPLCTGPDLTIGK